MLTRWHWPPDSSAGRRSSTVGVEADLVEQVEHRRTSRSPAGAADGCVARPSAMIGATDIRGFSDERGSWKTIWIAALDRRRPGASRAACRRR